MTYKYMFSIPIISNENNFKSQSSNPFAPNYKRETKKHYPPEFYNLRPYVIKRFSDRCFLCAELGNEIHHIDYDTMNNDKNNLMLLCKVCHAKTNFNRNYWEEYLKNKMRDTFQGYPD